MNRKVLISVLLVFLFIAIIVAAIEQSINSFFTWFLVGTWILFTIRFYEKIKQAREFNSPLNTPFFTLGPIYVGGFYNFWGYYSTFLNDNLLEGTNLFVSFWTLIFSLPYLLFAYRIIYFCFKKYNIAYIYKTNAVRARRYGYFCSILLISLGILILLVVGFYWEALPFDLVHHGMDIILLCSIFISAYLVIVPGAMARRQSLPEITPGYIDQRRRAINQITSTPAIERSPARPRPSSSSSSGSRIRMPSRSHSRPRSTSGVRSTQTTKSKPSSKPRITSTTKSKAKKVNYEKYRPKTGTLSIDDFKCMFCFQLPKLPEDEGRRIVLCPNCNYPAHGDEFEDWMRSSNLCSRCDAPIPSNFQRNPPSMKVKNYLAVIKHFANKR